MYGHIATLHVIVCVEEYSGICVRIHAVYVSVCMLCMYRFVCAAWLCMALPGHMELCLGSTLPT